jgi:hypothetical protein
LVFAKDSSWITSRSLWTIDVWEYEDFDLKTDVRILENWTTDCPVKMQPLHKVFLFYPECSQNTKNSHVLHVFYLHIMMQPNYIGYVPIWNLQWIFKIQPTIPINSKSLQ